MPQRVGFGKHKKFGFVRITRSRLPTMLSVVQRIGDAIIGGDFTGNGRGQYALDLQIERSAITQVASGSHSLAFGRLNTSAGAGGIAVGDSNAANGEDSIAVGRLNDAEGARSAAFGYANFAGGDDSFVLGHTSTAAVTGAVAVGYDADAEGTYALAVGQSAQANAANSIAFGSATEADGLRSIALGYNALASADDEAVIAGTVLNLQTAFGTKKRVLTVDDLGGGASWGGITGTLSDQTDLNTALNARVLKAGDTMTGALTIVGSADVVQSTVFGKSGQTADLQQWRSNAGAVLASFTKDGYLYLPGDVYPAKLADFGGYGYFALEYSTHGFAFVNASGGVSGFFTSAAQRAFSYNDSHEMVSGPYNSVANVHLLVRSAYLVTNQITSVFQANASQTVNITEWRDSSAAVLLSVDPAGIVQTASGNESTGAGSAALGANSPAVTNTAPYKWLKFKTSDGSTVYIPAWK